jgi:hypothetical protein
VNANDGATTYVNRTVHVNNTALTTFAGQSAGRVAASSRRQRDAGADGNNTYDGPTTNSAGTLMVNGTWGAVTVASAPHWPDGHHQRPTTVLAGGAIATRPRSAP